MVAMGQAVAGGEGDNLVAEANEEAEEEEGDNLGAEANGRRRIEMKTKRGSTLN